MNEWVDRLAAATVQHATWCPCGGYLPSDFAESQDAQASRTDVKDEQ